MARWLKITLTIVALLVVAGGGAYYWLFGDGNTPAGIKPFDFDIGGVRAAADEMPGGKASDIRVEKVASFTFPATATVGGEGWNSVPMGAYSYQLILPTDTIVID